MGVLANHVPSIEQLKPGLVEIIEESGGSKQFFCMWNRGTFLQESSASTRKISLASSGVMNQECGMIDVYANIWTAYSVRGFCHRSARLRSQHQCCGGLPP